MGLTFLTGLGMAMYPQTFILNILIWNEVFIQFQITQSRYLMREGGDISKTWVHCKPRYVFVTASIAAKSPSIRGCTTTNPGIYDSHHILWIFNMFRNKHNDNHFPKYFFIKYSTICTLSAQYTGSGQASSSINVVRLSLSNNRARTYGWSGIAFQ